MRLILSLASLLLAAAPIAGANAPIVSLPGGSTLAPTGNLAYDANTFSGDSRFLDEDRTRRTEIGIAFNANAIDAGISYDVENRAWLDVHVRVDIGALAGSDAGRIRAGYFKVPFGLEGLGSTRASPFMESSLPTQALFPGRRLGAEWTHARQSFQLQGAFFGGNDLEGANPGTTTALRGLWTPAREAGRVLHLGAAASVERPRGDTSAEGVAQAATARLRARPGAGLTDVRLLDGGAVGGVREIRRAGLEFLWIHGPLSIQGEALQARIARADGAPDYEADGQYVFGSWVLTGEARPYSAGAVGNVVPTRRWGAVELLARYSRADLDDGLVEGGRGHDWTLGANWYLGRNLKFQVNYVDAHASRQGVPSEPDVLELRAQFHF